MAGRLTEDMKRNFLVLAQSDLARAAATCLALGMSVLEIEATVRNALAGASIAKRRHVKKVEAGNG